jgi:hypothetical protein
MPSKGEIKSKLDRLLYVYVLERRGSQLIQVTLKLGQPSPNRPVNAISRSSGAFPGPGLSLVVSSGVVVCVERP